MWNSAGRRSVRGIVSIAAAALTLALLGAVRADAATLLVPAGSGVTLPAGMAMTPDGSLWVSDHLGVCRVELTPVPRVIESPYCSAARAAGVGPDVPFQLTFDPATNNFYVAERNGGSGGLWRMRWDALTGSISSDPSLTRRIASVAGRMFTVSLAPGGAVDFAGTGGNIYRVADPTALDPAPAAIAGQATGTVLAMAHLGGTMYLAEELVGFTRITGGSMASQPVPGSPMGLDPTALAADEAHGRLYIGTTHPDGVDDVLAYTPADNTDVDYDSYDAGFAGVSSLATKADGTLLVADNPANSAGSLDPLNRGRVFTVPFGPLNLPRVTITRGPAFSGASRDVSFDFVSTAPSASLECRFGTPPITAAWTACPAPAGFYHRENLADGTHSFEVRAFTGNGANRVTGPAAAYTFSIDNTKPTVVIDNAAGDRTAVGGNMRMAFSSNELFSSFACRIDGGAFTSCTSPKRYQNLPLGPHEFEVVATDLAGNKSTPVLWDFTAVAASPAPVEVEDKPAPKADKKDDGLAKGQSSSNAAIGCRPVSPGRAKATIHALRGHTLTVRFSAPLPSKWAKFTLRRSGGSGKSRGAVIEMLGYVRVSGTKAATARLTLTKAQRKRFRAGQSRVSVSYGTCRTLVGRYLDVSNKR